ncbi:MAG: hypothetical protein HKM86_12735 [Deltaproteobacteria bacterium]|nr:hypothetical protein [Deltaproteobacteria bacterium]
MITATFLLLSLPFSAPAQEQRGGAGLPTYIKGPTDRPPPVGIEPTIVAQGQTTDAFLETIPQKDSVIVIHGKLNLGGRDYFSAYPIFRAGSLYGTMKACKKEFVMRPQYKAAQREGYTMFVIIKDTATEADCWDQFRNLGAVDLSCDQIMVKTAEQSDPVVWNNPDSSYANSYDLRRFQLDPVTPK